MENNIPPCANWNIWEGKEIEGFTDIGEVTLFIRNATMKEILEYAKKYDRIWFTDEFPTPSRNKVNKLLSLGKKIIFDLTYEHYLKLARNNRYDILSNFQLYVRMNLLILKENDHIKIGQTFYEESFLVGNGKKVETNLYHEDKFLK